MRRLNKQKLYDLAAAAPLIFWFSLAAVGCFIRIEELLDAGGGAMMLSAQVANMLFFLLVITLLVIRRLPTRKAEGVGATLAGFLGCSLPLLVLVLPRREVSQPLNVILSASGLIGIVAAIYVMLWLGRSFSILPQARGLVIDGPYRLVRHPLYLAEFLVIFSRAFELAQPWPFVIVMLVFGSQIARMGFEEQILCETYPAYRDYMRKTARLIPGFY
jgi:protein-S-isoprenylcysteine O-methyltransferase Ste14